MVTCRVVPHLKPFRALRYDPGTVGPLDAVVSPPHDVVTPDRREALVTASPYNAVRLLNPGVSRRGRQADRRLAGRGRARPRDGAGGLDSRGDVPGPGRGNADAARPGRACRALALLGAARSFPTSAPSSDRRTRAWSFCAPLRMKLSPVFLVHEGASPAIPERAPDMEATLDGVTSRLWRIAGDDAIAEALGRVDGPPAHRRRPPSLRDGARLPRGAGNRGVRLRPCDPRESRRRRAGDPAHAPARLRRAARARRLLSAHRHRAERGSRHRGAGGISTATIPRSSSFAETRPSWRRAKVPSSTPR